MKRPPGIPLPWACAVLAGLVVVLSMVNFFAADRLENDAVAVQHDAVPGLIDAHSLRFEFAEGLAATLGAAATTDEATRAVFLRRLAESDEQVRRLADAYTGTILINPKVDRRNYHRVLAARDEFFSARDRYLQLARSGDAAAAQAWSRAEMMPRYTTLLEAADVLADYNDQTGTTFAASLVRYLGYLRWSAFILIGLVAGVVVGVGRSLAYQHQAERAARESERRFSAAFQGSPVSMVISRRANGMIIDVNESASRLYGRPAAEMIGRTALDLGLWRTPEDRAELLRHLDEQGRMRNYRRRHVFPDNREVTLLLSSETLVLDGVDCILTVGQDITDLVEAEEALARRAEELRIIIDSSVIGMNLVDRDGRNVRTNPALERFLGYTADELRRMTFTEYTHPEEAERSCALFARLVAGDINSYQLEKRFLRKDGTVVWGNLFVSVLRDPGGRFVYAIGMIEDVSERKQAELALHESELAREHLQSQLIVAQKLEALGQLAGGVAHDFNNILAAIILYLDLLRTEKTVTSTTHSALAEVANAARRAAGLTRQLLLFSRREPAQRQVVDLIAVVDTLLNMLGRLLGAQYTLTKVAPADPLWLHADPGMLEQIVMNLVVNARDAMPRGGPIELRLEAVVVDAAHTRTNASARAGAFTRLRVIDTGCGMSPATQARIFEPFFTTKAAGQGTGLGLATVFGIVRQHEGWIEVQSAEGKGSTFAVYLPLHGESRPPPVAEPAAASERRAGGETILVAEDDEMVRLVTVKILRQNGYQVLEARNGREARQMLAARRDEVDLLLSDVVMPEGVTGDELVAGLARDGWRPKVILMSGYNAQVDTAAIVAAGDGYLGKPFDTNQLLRAVRAKLDEQPVRA